MLRSRNGAAALGNGTMAAAAVMRYSCWRGEFFEGCELRCGERQSGPGWLAIGVSGGKTLTSAMVNWSMRACSHGRGRCSTGVSSTRNVANLVRHRIAIYPGPCVRSKPSRWLNHAGGTCQVEWHPQDRKQMDLPLSGGLGSPLGVDERKGSRRQGTHRERIPREAGRRESVQDRERRFEGAVKFKKDASVIQPE
jgi:hypothetical protein